MLVGSGEHGTSRAANPTEVEPSTSANRRTRRNNMAPYRPDEPKPPSPRWDSFSSLSIHSTGS